MGWHHGDKLFPILSVLVINVLHKHFVMSDICGGGTSDMIYITYSNFIAIAIKWFLRQQIENLWCTEISNSRCNVIIPPIAGVWYGRSDIAFYLPKPTCSLLHIFKLAIWNHVGIVSIWISHFASIWIQHLKIRRCLDYICFITAIPMLRKWFVH